MKDQLKILFILVAGVIVSASPYLPANPTTTAMLAAVARKKADGGPSYTLQQTVADSSANVLHMDGNTRKWVATRMTVGATHTVTRLEFWLIKVGSPGGSLTAKIWEDSSDVPGTLLATSTNSVVADSIDTSAEWIAFDFDGQSITGSTNYFLGVTNGTAGNGGNKITITLGSNFNTTNWETTRSADGITWNVENNGRGVYCRTYISP